MTFKQLVIIGFTHGMWQIYGALAAMHSLHHETIIGVLIGLLTYRTYKYLLTGEN